MTWTLWTAFQLGFAAALGWQCGKFVFMMIAGLFAKRT